MATVQEHRARRPVRLPQFQLLAIAICAGFISGCQPTRPVQTLLLAATGTPPPTDAVLVTQAAATATPTATATPKPTPTVASTAVPTASDAAIALSNGPHLFLDDYLIAYCNLVTRRVIPPERKLPAPIIAGLQGAEGDHNINFATVALRDPQTGRFRMWYTSYDLRSRQRYSAYIESPDGVNWERPSVEVAWTRTAPIVDIFDQGADYAVPTQRYIAITSSDVPPTWLPSLLVSPDALHWQPVVPNISSPVRYGELWRIFKEIGTGGFGLLHRWNRSFDWTDLAGIVHHNTTQNPTTTRLFAYSSSPNLGLVQETQVIYSPGSQDSGVTEFYSMSNVIRRGDYYLAALDILRDDVTAPGSPANVNAPMMGQQFSVFGIGYTVLAWSRDGQHWFRDYETDPYFLMSSEVKAWDHAVAWINSIVEVGDSVYLYYGGYQYGHKVYVDRQIGLATTARDRYVAQVAGNMPGTLRTPLVSFSARAMTLNASVGTGGQIQLVVLGADGLPLPGFGPGDCAPIRGDNLAARVTCAGPFASLADRPVYLQLNLTNAELFAFSLESAVEKS